MPPRDKDNGRRTHLRRSSRADTGWGRRADACSPSRRPGSGHGRGGKAGCTSTERGYTLGFSSTQGSNPQTGVRKALPYTSRHSVWSSKLSPSLPFSLFLSLSLCCLQFVTFGSVGVFFMQKKNNVCTIDIGYWCVACICVSSFIFTSCSFLRLLCVCMTCSVFGVCVCSFVCVNMNGLSMSCVWTCCDGACW